jgi:hypothetical protein
MIKFQFKQTNHEPPCHYHPSALVAGGSVGGTAWPGSSAGGTEVEDVDGGPPRGARAGDPGVQRFRSPLLDQGGERL